MNKVIIEKIERTIIGEIITDKATDNRMVCTVISDMVNADFRTATGTDKDFNAIGVTCHCNDELYIPGCKDYIVYVAEKIDTSELIDGDKGWHIIREQYAAFE